MDDAFLLTIEQSTSNKRRFAELGPAEAMQRNLPASPEGTTKLARRDTDAPLTKYASEKTMKLISTPLMKETQLNAIFLTFDANKDGAISFDELERLMRMLDPHKRLAKLKPIEVPHEPTPLEVGLSAAYEAARPGLEQLEQLWYTVNPLAARRDDDDDDDDDDGDDGDEAR